LNARVVVFAGVTACLTVTLTGAEQLLPPLPEQKIAAHRITLIRDWARAVELHIPGELDAAVASLIAWTSDDIARAWLDVQALIAVVRRPTTTRFRARPSDRTIDFSSSAGLATLREVAASIRTRAGGSDLFYKRAATLHADIAMTVKGTAGASQSRSLIVKTSDGAQVGLHSNLVHWEFGRLLLDAVRQPAEDSFVRDWYRASMGFKLRIGELDTPHFDRAGELFPRDAIVRFQLGSLHEWFADPRVQSAADSVSLPRGIHLEVKSEGAELRNAETQFRRALEGDPAHVEARVRRGRVLSRLGRPKEAAAELRAALDRKPEPLLEYYAQLFLAAAEEALDRFAEARVAYARAQTLYPRAQVPRLGLSQLLHREGNRSVARDTLAPALQSHVRDRKADPWWTYRSAPARHTDDLFAVVYRTLAAGGTR